MGFQHKKSLGQHFLNNPRIPKRMADAAEVREGDTILEIGPGTGALTRELLSRGAQVIAVEADARAIVILKETFEKEISAQKLVIFNTDARKLKLSSFNLTEHAYKVVSNIPYYLSGMLFRTFLETAIQPSTVVFLVQREVAERIARDSKESLLSLSVKAYGTPAYITTVARGNFTPPPNVDSAIISITNISHEHFNDVDEYLFFTLLHAGFASRRKQLVGNLTHVMRREDILSAFSTLGLPLEVRGEDLNINMWLKLVRALALTTHSPRFDQS